MTRTEEWLRLVRYPYEGRVRMEFDKLPSRYCGRWECSLPHIWQDYPYIGRYFCRGEV